MSFSDYIEAHNYAVNKARQFHMVYGIEKMNQFGKIVYSVKMLPTDPNKRFGFELRCEVITDESPLYQRKEEKCSL
jgi:hypothetical protein